MIDEDADLRAFLLGLDPNTCDDFRRFPDGCRFPADVREDAGHHV